MVNLGFWIGFVLKTAKMKLPLHDLLIVKATAPFSEKTIVLNDINQTLLEYVLEYRLNTAKQLLDDTKMSITDISYHCGFSSNAYFGKIFREKYGMTPLQYRNRNIDKQDVLN